MFSINYKVSIITVVYNGVKTIEQTIQSVLGQTYKNIEYIIIDGASTDGTQQIIEKYIDNIFYYVSEKDSGLYYAMNKGIQKATGEIIGIINSDDWYVADAVENIVECFNRSDAELVHGRMITIMESGTERISNPAPLENMWYRMVLSHPTVFIKKDVYDRLGTFDVKYRLSSDYELMLRLYSNHIKFEYIDRVITYFRSGGLSTTKQKEMCNEGYEVSMSYVDRAPCKDKVLSKIKETYDLGCFYREIVNKNMELNILLNKYFRVEISNIIIFGTGFWSEVCYNALDNSDIIITHIVDNNISKWNTEFHGVKIINPNELRNMEAYVLIAVGQSGEEIRKQLTNMENNRLKYVTVKELFIQNR